MRREGGSTRRRHDEPDEENEENEESSDAMIRADLNTALRDIVEKKNGNLRLETLQRMCQQYPVTRGRTDIGGRL